MLLVSLATLGVLLMAGLLLRASVRFVHAREAAVVCDRITGNVRSLVADPGPVLLLPRLETLQRFDTSLRIMRVDVWSATTADGFSATASADITFALDPALMRAADLNQILPFLDHPEGSVRSWVEHILRLLVGENDEASLLRRRLQADIARQFQAELQAGVAAMGIRIHAVRLLCQRDPRMLEAQLAAEARALQWSKLAEALGTGFDPAKLLPFEALDRLDGGNARVLASFGQQAERGRPGDGASLPVQWVLDTR